MLCHPVLSESVRAWRDLAQFLHVRVPNAGLKQRSWQYVSIELWTCAVNVGLSEHPLVASRRKLGASE